MYGYEQELINKGLKYIGGTDEAGRGPLIGPVVAACVVLPLNYKNEQINDSKKLTEKKREELYKIIEKDALTIGIGIVEPEVIDEINIYEASRLAMIKAYQERIDYYNREGYPELASYAEQSLLRWLNNNK